MKRNWIRKAVCLLAVLTVIGGVLVPASAEETAVSAAYTALKNPTGDCRLEIRRHRTFSRAVFGGLTCRLGGGRGYGVCYRTQNRRRIYGPNGR